MSYGLTLFTSAAGEARLEKIRQMGERERERIEDGKIENGGYAEGARQNGGEEVDGDGNGVGEGEREGE